MTGIILTRLMETVCALNNKWESLYNLNDNYF